MQSTVVLAAGYHPRHSVLGIIWTAVTAAVMFALAAGKARTGRALDNPVLVTEGRVTVIDGILAVAVLLGLILNAVAGWWWADPAAGYVPSTSSRTTSRRPGRPGRRRRRLAEPGQQRVRAELAVAHADPVLGGQVGRDPARVVARHGEADDADAVGASPARSRSNSTPGERGRPCGSRSTSAASCASSAPSGSAASVRQACASAAAPSTFGVPPSCRCGAAAHGACRRSDRRGPRHRPPGTAGAASSQSRRPTSTPAPNGA